MKLHVYMPTRALKDPLIEEGLDYLKKVRSPWSASAHFMNPKKAFDEDRKGERIAAESKELWQKSEGYFRIALSDQGTHYSSASLSDYLEKLSNKETKVAFIIGGAFGLSSELVTNAHASLSLSSMTFPHRMAFLMLSEQLYRAYEIKRGSLYHK